MNFPTRHPLYGSGNIADADVVLGLDVPDLWYATHSMTPVNKLGMESRATTKAGAKLIHIFSGDLFAKSNYQDFGRYTEVDLSIAADAETTLPALIEACKKLITADRKSAFEDPRQEVAEVFARNRQRDLEAAAFGFDASPISTARVSAELWNALKGEDWSLVSDVTFFSYWPLRLWDFTKHYQYIGGHGAYGVGYQAPASVGAALANRKYGRISVNIQCDGDLNYAPGVLWTAVASQDSAADRHAQQSRLPSGADVRAGHGRSRRNAASTAPTSAPPSRDPNIDYATMAKAYGMYSAGPIERSQGSRARPQSRHSSGQARRAGLDRRGHAAALGSHDEDDLDSRSRRVSAASRRAAAQAPAGNADNGKQLFLQDGCFQCHGYVGQGTKDGARIGPPVLNVQALIRYVRRPPAPCPPSPKRSSPTPS